MAHDHFEGPDIGLGKLLNDRRFHVPAHQREYSWTEDQIGQLFDDIHEAQSKGLTSYFLGLMVFIPGEKGELQVLDGQQRLATAALVFSAIRTWLRQYDEYSDDATQITMDYLGQRVLGRGQELQPRLVLNETNNSTFEHFVVQNRPTLDVRAALDGLKRYDPNRRILEGLLYCRKRVDEIASSGQDVAASAERLFDIVNFLRDGVRVVRLTVKNETDAYTVFETLNDRGLDLSVLDLVKNYLFGRADTEGGYRLRDLKARWAQMMSTLSNVRGDDFLRAYWTSRHGRVRVTNLFPDLKKKYTSARGVVELSTDMLTVAEQYAGLEQPGDPVWGAFSQEFRDRLTTLKMLGASPVHPVILAALARFEVREIERLLRLLEVLLVRYQFIGGGSTGQLETTCARLALDVYQRRVATATAAAEFLRDIMPSDDEFEDKFTVKQERNNTKAQYVLRRMEEEMRRREHGQMHDALGPGKVLTVEHVLPRNPGTEWKDVIGRDATVVEEFVYRLGNLCLLNKINKELGRKGWDIKRPVLAGTPLLVTQQAAGYEEWNRDAIEDRQAKMAKLARTIWYFQ